MISNKSFDGKKSKCDVHTITLILKTIFVDKLFSDAISWKFARGIYGQCPELNSAGQQSKSLISMVLFSYYSLLFETQ